MSREANIFRKLDRNFTQKYEPSIIALNFLTSTTIPTIPTTEYLTISPIKTTIIVILSSASVALSSSVSEEGG